MKSYGGDTRSGGNEALAVVRVPIRSVMEVCDGRVILIKVDPRLQLYVVDPRIGPVLMVLWS